MMYLLIVLILVLLKTTLPKLNMLWNSLLVIILIPFMFSVGLGIGILIKHKETIINLINML